MVKPLSGLSRCSARLAVLNGELHAEFDALLSGLRENFQPVATFEECSAALS